MPNLRFVIGRQYALKRGVQIVSARAWGGYDQWLRNQNQIVRGSKDPPLLATALDADERPAS
jgi:hypothetical protein